jgi:hypothetical protein
MGVVDLQAFIALGTVFISIVLHLLFQPFDTTTKNGKKLHNLEFIALCVCWFTFWGGLLFFLGHEKKGSVHSNVLITTTILLVLANSTFLLVSIYILAKTYIIDRRIAKQKKLDQNQEKTESEEHQNEENPTRVVPIESNNTDDLEDEQNIENVIDEHHGHEERLNALHQKQSKRAKRNTQLRLLERSKIKSSKILAQVPGFSQMNEIKISKMVDNMKLIKYRPGDVICQEGDAANSFYVILEGNCAITSLRHGSRRMALIGEYDFFGESMMTTNVAFRTRVATVTVVPEDEETEAMKNKSRPGAQVLVLERNQYDALCNNGDIDLSATINGSIEKVAKQRKNENRENLLAGRAMTRLRSMRKDMGGEVKIMYGKDGKEVAAEVKLKHVSRR